MGSDRRAGVLVHPTSLPGPCAGGDLGPSSVRFLDWAAEAGMRVWQVLPLGPIGPGGSPYDSRSAFAGNPWLLSPARIEQSGLLDSRWRESNRGPIDRSVDFAALARQSECATRLAWEDFCRRGSEAVRQEFEEFVDHPDRGVWLEDWVLYAALKRHHRDAAWFEWDLEVRLREPVTLRRVARSLAGEIDYQRFLQFLFHRQWAGLRRAAARRGIAVYGDLPFYVAHDSADVWSHRELFKLDEQGRPRKVAGVPPDYFSETGQLWGNPVYDWERTRERGYHWWIARLRANLQRFDLIRLDHFRGFAAYWEVDAAAETAAEGNWVPGPGRRLFDAVAESLGPLKLVAEDLGLITPDVVELRETLDLPGMHVLQFLLCDEQPDPLVGVTDRSVIYTGTHDNDTTRGWFESLDPPARERVLTRLACRDDQVVDRTIELAYRSVAELSVIPLQDLLGLGTECRMNRPGASEGNWRWRVDRYWLDLASASRYRRLAESSGRTGEQGQR